MILNLKGRYIKFMKRPKDITSIEIKETDEIYKYIQFLNYDLNYNHNGYNIYNDSFVFSIHYPLGLDAAAQSGKITDIYIIIMNLIIIYLQIMDHLDVQLYY